MAIAHKVLVQFEPQRDVAKEFRIGQSVVSKLIRKAKKNPAFFHELKSEEDTQQLRKKEAIRMIDDMLVKNTVLESAEQVTKELDSRSNLRW